MVNPTILFLISGICVLIGLLHGAYYDIKIRKAPKQIWKFVAPISAISTILWYILEFQQTYLTVVVPLIITSSILSLATVIMGFKQGNGGDWRALFYVSILTPWVAPFTFVLSCVFGICQVGIDKIRKSPLKSAWLISITVGYFVSYGYFLY
jgi:hypothetical protein